jgi:DNA-binding Xre family transcriptional regulator
VPDNINTFSGPNPDSCIDCVVTLIGVDQPTTPLPLATIRRRKLLSQRALAREAGVALSTVYLLEAGKTERVTFKVMRSVSHALGVPPEAIAEFARALG